MIYYYIIVYFSTIYSTILILFLIMALYKIEPDNVPMEYYYNNY